MRRLLLAPLLLLALLLAGTGSVRADDEEPGAALLASGAVFVEVALDPAEGAVVGQHVSLLLTLGTTHWFSGAPTLPDPVPAALMRAILIFLIALWMILSKMLQTMSFWMNWMI